MVNPVRKARKVNAMEVRIGRNVAVVTGKGSQWGLSKAFTMYRFFVFSFKKSFRLRFNNKTNVNLCIRCNM